MATYEIIMVIFLLVMAYITFYSYKRNQITKYGMAFWVFVWMVGILLVAFHPYLNSVLNPLNITRVFDLYTIAGFAFFLFVIFYLFRAVQRIEKKIEFLTRSLALKEKKKEV